MASDLRANCSKVCIIGCVSYREQFFPGDKISIKRFEQAYRKACMETLNIRESFQAEGWNEVIGSSGTFKAIANLLDIDGKSELITRNGLEQLKAQICNIGSIDALKNLEKLKPHRRAILPAGVAIWSAIFDPLDIKQLRTSTGALREGLAYDLVGRLTHEDVRERTIPAMMNRYEVEPDRAERVEQLASQMFQQTQADWNLTKADSELLSWAARLHEIG
ncbi:MAG: exopolyphosphatase, partial [Pseudomonadales bacterium]|nr:exopolyphosphatase [Pseudomonadales bacterium]